MGVKMLIAVTGFYKLWQKKIQRGLTHYLRTSARRPCMFHQDPKTRHRKRGSGNSICIASTVTGPCCSCTPLAFRKSTATLQSLLFSITRQPIYRFTNNNNNNLLPWTKRMTNKRVPKAKQTTAETNIPPLYSPRLC